MKNRLLLLGSLLLALSACKRESTAQTPPGASSLSMKINGVEWKAEEGVTGSLSILKNHQFVLAGKATPGTKEQNLNIVLENVTCPGTYTTNPGAEYDIAQYAETDANGDIAMYKSQKDGLFTVVITRCNGTVTEGTFSGTLPVFLGATAQIIITDGKFQTK